MAVNNEARQRREKLRKRARGAIKKAHALHILCEADVALIVILGSKRYEYPIVCWGTHFAWHSE